MPTGYTAEIKDGITFQEFAMRCARAFGATIELRDEPLDAPIPETFGASNYHQKALAAARVELERLRTLSPSEIEAAALAEFSEATKQNAQYIKESRELREKYAAMLAQAEAWNPPTPDHAGMKSFMVQQITESIKFDCSDDYYEQNRPVCLSGAGWIAKAIASAERNVAYHAKHYAEDVERAQSRTAWVSALRESLAHEVVLEGVQPR